jgi:hypothetical protein
MPILKFDNDVSVKNFVGKCSSEEIHELIYYLIDRGDLIKDGVSINEYIVKSDEEQNYENALQKLHGKWNMISKLDMSIIIELSKKF